MPTAISIQNITKSYPPLRGASASTAVDNVSLDIEPGELFFLLGPSGCGKTTLLRMIAGFIEPTAGKILFNGEDMTWKAPQHRNTGMVFQSYALWPHMTVGANVAFGLSVRKTPAAETARKVHEALSAVQMEMLAERKPNELSGGQQQRVALARAIVFSPDVLLLDEPLSNLDAKLRLELRLEIRRICKSSGITTVYVTHDQHEALSMADRIAIMRNGRLVQLGTPRELYTRPASKFVGQFLGEMNFSDGVVESIDGPTQTVRFEWGSFKTDRLSNAIVGLKVTIGIRPECISTCTKQTSVDYITETVLTTNVVETIYLGSTTQWRLSRPENWSCFAPQDSTQHPLSDSAEVRFDLKSASMWSSTTED